MFTARSTTGYQEEIAGIAKKTLVYGDHNLMTEFWLKKGAQLPSHCHPQEQTGYLVSGKMKLIIGDTSYTVRPGDSWSIPSDIVHHADVLEDSVAIEVFSPVRKDYLPENNR